MKFTSFHSNSRVGRGNLTPSVSNLAEVDRAKEMTVMISINRIASSIESD
jgi:hypothetical protein